MVLANLSNPALKKALQHFILKHKKNTKLHCQGICSFKRILTILILPYESVISLIIRSFCDKKDTLL